MTEEERKAALKFMDELVEECEPFNYNGTLCGQYGKDTERRLKSLEAIRQALQPDDYKTNVEAWLSDVPPLDDYHNMNAKMQWLIRETQFAALYRIRLKEIDQCFEAAYIEGLSEKIHNDEDLADLINRRLLPAREIAQQALKETEEK